LFLVASGFISLSGIEPLANCQSAASMAELHAVGCFLRLPIPIYKELLCSLSNYLALDGGGKMNVMREK
jgi:hypothetical protein